MAQAQIRDTLPCGKEQSVLSDDHPVDSVGAHLRERGRKVTGCAYLDGAQRQLKLVCSGLTFLDVTSRTVLVIRIDLGHERPKGDVKEPALRFDSYKFLFHRARLATFATQSARMRPYGLRGPMSAVGSRTLN